MFSDLIYLYLSSSFLMTFMSMAATVAFSVTAVLAIRRDSDIDVVSAAMLGIITSVGGGTIRDLVLGVPVFWSQNLSYIWISIPASVAALYARNLFSRESIHSLLLYLDGFGAAMFGIQAAEKVWDMDFGLPVAPVILGVVTAIGGGLMRDVLAERKTLMIGQDIYATPVLLGCSVLVLILEYFPEYRVLGAFGCITGTFLFRAAVIHWDLSMPAFTRGTSAR